MNVRIQYDSEFLAAVYTESGLMINSYTAVMQMITNTENKQELNTAMERLRCFINSILQDAVFIHEKHKDHAQLLRIMGVNVTTLPDEPIEQIIGMMLHCKLNAIMEGRLTVTSVDITSSVSDGVWYQHDSEENLGPFQAPGWWNNAGTLNHNIEIVSESEEKIVKVTPNTWAEYDLMWPDNHVDHTGNIIVYANFGKNEDDSIR